MSGGQNSTHYGKGTSLYLCLLEQKLQASRGRIASLINPQGMGEDPLQPRAKIEEIKAPCPQERVEIHAGILEVSYSCGRGRLSERFLLSRPRDPNLTKT